MQTLRDLFERYSQDKLVLGIAAAVVVIVLLIVIALIVRWRGAKRRREAHIMSQLVAMEREKRLAAAVEQLQYSKAPANLATQIAEIIQECLSLSLLAIYAGRSGDEWITDIVGKGTPAKTGALGLPKSLPTTLMREYTRPQITRLASLAAPPPGNPSAAAYQTAGDPSVASPGGAPSDQAVAGGPSSVVLFPWGGPFGWSGLMVTANGTAIDAESLGGLQEPVSRVGGVLGVALELEREAADVGVLDQRASRTLALARSLVASLEESSPLSSIVREVAALIEADSAALWRVDQAASVVAVVACHGLKSDEFLPLPLGQGFAGSVAESGQTLAIKDAPSDLRCLFPREARESGIGSYLGVPILAGGKTAGVIEVHTGAAHEWTADDTRLLQSAAELIARVFKSIEARGNRLRVETAYMKLSESFAGLRSEKEVMEAAVEVLGHALGVSRAIVIEFNQRGQSEPVTHEYRVPNVVSAASLTFDEEVRSRALAAGDEPLQSANSREQSLIPVDLVARLQIESEVAVRIKLADKLAIIHLHQCDRRRDWQPDEVEFAGRVGKQIARQLSDARALAGATRDRDIAHENARRAQEAATRSGELMAALPEMVIGLDQQGRVNFFNSAAGVRLGLQIDDIGRMAEMTESLAMSDDSLWDKIVASQTVSRFEGELLPYKKTGSLEMRESLRVSVSVAPLRSKAGEVAGHLVVVTDVGHLSAGGDGAARVKEIEQKAAELERWVSEARQAQIAAQAAAESSRKAEAQTRNELDRVREDETRGRRSAQQLLEINRLKSEFIVNAGHELESSLESILGFSEMLEQGSYGPLTEEQLQAVRGVLAWARRIKSDIELLIEYGARRSRRLDAGDGK